MLCKLESTKAHLKCIFTIRMMKNAQAKIYMHFPMSKGLNVQTIP